MLQEKDRHYVANVLNAANKKDIEELAESCPEHYLQDTGQDFDSFYTELLNNFKEAIVELRDKITVKDPDVNAAS